MISALTEELRHLGLSGPDFLTFNPPDENSWIRAHFDDIPPYLIRVFTPRSAGSTDEFWAKSRDSRHNNELNTVDLFARDNNHVANMLNIHLRWWGKNGNSDNITSWTSSWLFALQYIFHLHKNIKDASTFDDIKICMIDTTLFPKGCFVRDMDLIRAYEQFDPSLRDLGSLRSKRHKNYAGSYYFGEYLSQGALRIEGKCRIVPASAVLDNGLFTIQPLFREFENWELTSKPPWANEVIRLRKAFYDTETEQQQATDAEIRASIDIAEVFGSRFRLPMAAGLIGLLPRRADDACIQGAFRSITFTDAEKRECSRFEKMPTYEMLPEVNQFRDIMRSIHRHFCFQQMQQFLDHVTDTEAALRLATLHVVNEDLGYAERLPQPPGYRGLDVILKRLDTIDVLTQHLRQCVQEKSSTPHFG